MRLITRSARFGLFGIIIFTALCFSSTLPSSFRQAEQEYDVPAKASVKLTLQDSVASHAPRNRAIRRSRSGSSVPGVATSTNRKAMQTISSLGGCDGYASADGAQGILDKKNMARKTQGSSDNSKGKGPCKAKGPDSR